MFNMIFSCGLAFANGAASVFLVIIYKSLKRRAQLKEAARERYFNARLWELAIANKNTDATGYIDELN
jgi:hypothetical protein